VPLPPLLGNHGGIFAVVTIVAVSLSVGTAEVLEMCMNIPGVLGAEVMGNSPCTREHADS